MRYSQLLAPKKLSKADRRALEALVRKGQASVRKMKRALGLLALDRGATLSARPLCLAGRHRAFDRSPSGAGACSTHQTGIHTFLSSPSRRLPLGAADSLSA